MEDPLLLILETTVGLRASFVYRSDGQWVRPERHIAVGNVRTEPYGVRDSLGTEGLCWPNLRR